MKKIEPGLSDEVEMVVSKEALASHWGSGIVEVFSTPALVALMESAAEKAARPYLDEKETTVGAMVNIRHLAPTPLGMKVRAKAELIGVEGKRLLFHVEAFDEVEKIGEGEHERFVVDRERFAKKAREKASGNA